ncbi:MAG: exoribonuclease R [Carboxydocellales bacterium]
MLTEMNITDARKDISSWYNTVYNSSKPMIIKRNQREEVLVLRTDLQKMLLANYSLIPEFLREDDGSTTLALDQLEIYVNGETTEDAINEFIEELKIYANDFIERSQLFLNAPNRRSHFPYILRVLLCDTNEEIRSLLEI